MVERVTNQGKLKETLIELDRTHETIHKLRVGTEFIAGTAGLVGEFIIWPQVGFSTNFIPLWGGCFADGAVEITKGFFSVVKKTRKGQALQHAIYERSTVIS